MASSSESSFIQIDEISSKIAEDGAKYLLPLMEDVSEWLSKIFGIDINAENFLDMLDNGSLVCQLAKRVQSASEIFCSQIDNQCDHEEELKPLPKFLNKIHRNAKKESFQARDNTASFISWCKEIGIDESTLFESDGLVLHRQLRNVVTTLYELGKIAEKYDMTPLPKLVKLEREIVEEENNSQTNIIEKEPPKSGKDLDLEVRRIAAKFNMNLKRVQDRKYVLNDKVTLFVRALQRRVMVRVGGGWDEFEHYISKHGPEKVAKAFTCEHDNEYISFLVLPTCPVILNSTEYIHDKYRAFYT